MDRTGITVVSLCVILLVAWFAMEQKYASQMVRTPAGTNLPVTAQAQTAAAVSNKRTWNGRTLKWISVALALALACGAVTYYYHLTEPPDEDDDSTTPTQTAL